MKPVWAASVADRCRGALGGFALALVVLRNAFVDDRGDVLYPDYASSAGARAVEYGDGKR